MLKGIKNVCVIAQMCLYKNEVYREKIVDDEL